jgi:hypothetical protein
MFEDTAAHVVEDFFGVVMHAGRDSPGRPWRSVWKDVVYDATRDHKARVYRPSAAADEAGGKLPMLVYFRVYGMRTSNQPGFVPVMRRGRAPRRCALRPVPPLAAVEDGTTFLSSLSGQSALGVETELWLSESADFARTCGGPTSSLHVSRGGWMPVLVQLCSSVKALSKSEFKNSQGFTT